ncbi:unnamed protein product [Effrenium voratum]|nr:unnamed protein product [Effrenium voratum]
MPMARLLVLGELWMTAGKTRTMVISADGSLREVAEVADGGLAELPGVHSYGLPEGMGVKYVPKASGELEDVWFAFFHAELFRGRSKDGAMATLSQVFVLGFILALLKCRARLAESSEKLT